MPYNELLDMENITSKLKRDESVQKIISNLNFYCERIKELPDLKKILTYNLQTPGKRIRLLKSLIVAEMTGGMNSNIWRTISALEFSNSAIFIHDDIIDHDTQRKNKPTLNKLIGYEKALLIGNILHSLAFKEISEIDCEESTKKKILSDFSGSLAIEHVGQYMDLDFRWNFRKGLNEWESMVLRHSGHYVVSALQNIARLNKFDEKLIQNLEEYEKNCTLAGAAEDALLSFLGKKDKGDLLNGSFTVLVCFALKNKDLNKLDISNTNNLEKVIKSSDAINLVESYIKKKVNNAINALQPIKNGFEKNALIFLAKQSLNNLK